MIRATLNGLQPRDSRELDRNPFDWTDAPLFERPPQRMRFGELVALAITVGLAIFALAVKFAS